MLMLSRSRVSLIVVGLVFVAGLLIGGPARSLLADTNRDGFNNVVLEVTEAGSNLNVRVLPTQNGRVLDTLYWGDRVLWTGEMTSAEGYTWIKVGIGDGRTGWIVDVQGWTVTMDPVYTTPGMGVGAHVRVTADGSGSHCRAMPSTSSSEYRTMQTNDQMSVIGGPYQAEYWVWWQYRLSSGFECWIVDVPDWFNVVRAGTF
jgi:hypothetical protein